MTGILDQWIYFIKHAGSLEAVPEGMLVEPVRHAFEKARVSNMTVEEFEEYDKAGMAVTDAQGALQVARQEGRDEGEKIGIQKGRQEGEIAFLLRLLQRRFGPLPAWVEGQVQAAGPERLALWSERILEVRSLAEVFADGQQ
ncbi:MAG: DUF4351 domain-containing protein [Magnetococcales bacterium]|nr:DUF4351 domain-containing protein [Magnetococcales bacterium]